MVWLGFYVTPMPRRFERGRKMKRMSLAGFENTSPELYQTGTLRTLYQLSYCAAATQKYHFKANITLSFSSMETKKVKPEWIITLKLGWMIGGDWTGSRLMSITRPASLATKMWGTRDSIGWRRVRYWRHYFNLSQTSCTLASLSVPVLVALEKIG